MLRVRTLVLALCGALIGTTLSIAPADAQAPTPKVSLRASKGLVTFGQKVKLYGRTNPPMAGQQINIVSDGDVLASDTTNQEGRYSLWIKPRENNFLRAQWGAAISKRVHVRVKPRVSAYLSKVRLFSNARVAGRIAPAQKGRKVTVMLRRKGRTIARKQVPLRDGRSFATRFRIRSVAPLHAVAKLRVDDLAPGSDRSAKRRAPTPYLSQGDSGRHVKVLERRLMKLGYRLNGVGGSFDHTTSDALIAFHKVQGLPRVGSAADYTWRALVSPFRPKAVSRKGTHFEVDQTKQVLYIVRKGKIRTIVHVSTGANGYTRNGVWTVYRQLDGYSGGGLYYPSYFDGRRAVHGWSSVPTYPASHGCVRTPMWIAPWLNDKAFIGMTVRVYHS
jgi:hypothetical protein